MTPKEFETLCKKIDSGFEMLRTAITTVSGKPAGSWPPPIKPTDRAKLPKLPVDVVVHCKPAKGIQYFIGADVAEGLGGDYDASAFSVVGKFKDKYKQVAWFSSNTIDTFEFARVLDSVGRIYNDAVVAPEVNRFDSCLSELRFRCGYPNVYRWKVFDSTKAATTKLGWFTNVSSKARLAQHFRRFVKAKLLQINDPQCLAEMKVFVAGVGEPTDDSITALMIAAYVASESEYFA